jgi:hypothetical protein
MPELSVQEFVDEPINELEDRVESHFGANDKRTIESILRREIRAAEQRDADPADPTDAAQNAPPQQEGGAK